MYVATRGLYRMKPPTIIVPTVIKEDVEKLFEVHRSMDHSELEHTLVGLDVGNVSIYNCMNFWNFCIVKGALCLLFKILLCTSAGEELCLRKDMKVKAFKTYHGIPSQVIILKYHLYISFFLIMK